MFRVLLVSALIAVISADGYWDIQLSPQSIASVPFGPGHISVWQHATTSGRYYAMPLVYLLNTSARTKSNILTGVQEMAFDVLMWSEEAKEAVYRHIKAEYNSTVSKEHIEMLPMEKIRLVWRDRIHPIAPQFKLIDHWVSNTHLPSVVNFHFTCDTADACNDLKTAMKDSPDSFNALELEYVINGQRSARRSLTVTGRQMSNGRLWTKLTNMNSGDTRYVTSDDLKQIVSESVSSVIGTVVTDSDYVDTGDEVNLNQVLQNVLERNQVSSDQFQPHQWDSVFWEPTWARPDKIARYLNKALSKDTKDSKSFIVNENAGTSSSGGSIGGSFLGIIKASAGRSSSSSHQSKVQKEDILNTLRERHNHVEWDGEVFKVKPMKLFRLNLSTLKSSTNIATTNIQVRRYETVNTIKLRVSSSSGQIPSLSPQLVEARLTEKIQQSEAKLIQQTDQKLNPLKSKLNTLPGWPAGKYCILASGNCPPGFSRYQAKIDSLTVAAMPIPKGIFGVILHKNANNKVFIQAAKFGDSAITCTGGNCGRFPPTADINIVSCCK